MNHVCVCARVCAFELKERKKLIHKVKMQVGTSKTILTFNQDVVRGCEKEPVSKMWTSSVSLRRLQGCAVTWPRQESFIKWSRQLQDLVVFGWYPAPLPLTLKRLL